MMQAIKNIYQLGKKEILSLCRDWLLMALILYSFTAAVMPRMAPVTSCCSSRGS